MIITHTSLQALRSGFSKLFENAFNGEADLHYPKLCSQVPASTKIQTYGFMDRLPKMREHVGPRVIQNLRELAVQGISKPYELTVGVDADDVEDDNLGVYSMDFAAMGSSVRKHPDQLLKTAMQSGTTLTGFDSVAFFSTAHPIENQANQSNLTASGATLNTTNYPVIRAKMTALIGADGEPLDVMPDTLIVPPQLEGVGRQILNADFLANGETNVWKGSAKLVVMQSLANEPTVWYLADTSKPYKPFVYQQTSAPKFVQKNSPNDDNVFMDNQILYGARCRDAIVYGPWFLIHRAAA